METPAGVIEMLRVKAAAASTIMKAIEMLQPFNGDVGELTHFLKGGDRISLTIDHKEEAALLDPYDAAALRAALIGRITRQILNQIQAEEDTLWSVAKDRLKKTFGGGRWAPEEDLFRLYRLRRGRRQTEGDYAQLLLTRYHHVVAKMRETTEVAIVETQAPLIEAVLKVQLADATGKREGFPRERGFVACAQELIEASARCEEAMAYPEEHPWEDAEPRGPSQWRRPSGRTARRRGPSYGGDNRREIGRGARPPPRREGTLRPRGRGDAAEKKCFECGLRGHLAARCPKIACYECNSQGHLARNCPYMAKRTPERGEPMDINVQRVQRRRRSSETASTDSDDLSSSGESEVPRNRKTRVEEARSYREVLCESPRRARSQV